MKHILGYFCFFILCTQVQAFSMEDRIRNALGPEIGTKRDSLIVGIFNKGEVSFLSLGKSSPDSSTIFEIASITKTFTSLMLSIAIEKGYLQPDTTLGELRTEWKNEKLGSITLLELATHRSGLERLPCDFHYEDIENPYADYTEAELIASITDKVIGNQSDCKILPHPTETINYSNWGAALLGNAISAKVGLSYEEILKEWITGPLGMNDTVVSLSEDLKHRLIQGYHKNLKRAGHWSSLSMFGNGAILSSANDMMIYARAMLRPDETPFANAIRRVQTNQYQYIAYNWYMTPAGSIWHDGLNGGYSSLIKAYIHKDMSVFALSNTEREINCLIEAVEEIPCQIQ
ncbi:MAG: serine hydrolase domain-containing protein [Bacteriovoracaceae bacterium]